MSWPYTDWEYDINWVYPPWDFSSDFEDGFTQLLSQWWDPRYNGGTPVYPSYSYYNIGTQPNIAIEADATAPSGSNVLHVEAWAPTPNPYNRVYIGGLEYSGEYRYNHLTVSFYFKIPEAYTTVPYRSPILFEDGLENILLYYQNDTGQDLLNIQLPGGGTHTQARSDDWQLYEYHVDYLTGEWYVKLDNVAVGSGSELNYGYIPTGGMYFSIGTNLLTNSATYIDTALTNHFYIDNIIIDFEEDPSTWTCDCETPRFESQFGDYAYEFGGVRSDFPITVTEGDNTFLRFDTVSKIADKSFQIHQVNDFSFDIRMPSSSANDGAVFWLPYTVSIENYHDVSFYDYATLIYIYYDAATDTFNLDCNQYGAGTRIYPYMGETVTVSWPRPTDWQTVRMVWDYVDSTLTLYLDGVETTSYSLERWEDITEWADMWGYTFYPTGINWMGWLYPQWGSVFVGSTGNYRDAALIDIDNITYTGNSKPVTPEEFVIGDVSVPYPTSIEYSIGDTLTEFDKCDNVRDITARAGRYRAFKFGWDILSKDTVEDFITASEQDMPVTVTLTSSDVLDSFTGFISDLSIKTHNDKLAYYKVSATIETDLET
jgi:hypothetical protein